VLDVTRTALGLILLLTTALAVPTALRIRGRATFLVAAFVVGAASLVLVFMVLSLPNGLTRAWILVAQAMLAAASVAAWALTGRPRPPTGWRWAIRRAVACARDHRPEAVVVAVALVALIVQLVMAVGVAPNNWDSMTYHLARIGYWLENHSATPFVGGSIRQNGSPPNAEMIQGWTMALARSDRLANVVQWLALVGTALAIFSGARLLRFSPPAAALAAALFAVMPEPILEATTTQNDLVVSFFVVATALFGVRGIRDGSIGDLVIAAAAGGLAAGTKGTALFAGPALLLVLVGAVWGYRPRPRLVAAACALALAGVAAFGAFGYAFNLHSTGHVFGGVNHLVARTESVQANFVKDMWAFVDLPGMSVYWFQVPLQRVAEWVAGGFENRGFSYTVDSGVHEDSSAFGALGLFLFLPVVVGTAVAPRMGRDRRLLALGVLLYFVMFSTFVGWNIWVGRLMIPGVALGAPLLAVLASRAWLRWLAVVLALIGVVPSVLQNPLKPLLVPRHSPTAFRLNRIEQETRARGEMNPVLRDIERLVGDDAPLGFAGGEDSWDYPLFGAHLQRRVVRLDPSTVTYGLMRRDRLSGVVFFNVGPPPDALKAITLGPDYYLVRAAG
jgi:hypothetical protein